MIATLLLRHLVIFFLYMGAGFLLVKIGLLKSSDSKVLSVLTINVLIPCAILKSYQVDYTKEIQSGFMLALAVAVLSHLILFGIAYGISAVKKLEPTEKASIIYPNSANLILPLLSGVMGEKYVIYASAYACIQGLFLWTHCNSMMKGARNMDWKKAFLNLNLMAVILGIITFFSGHHLPQLVIDTMGGFSSALGPISMIVIGMLLCDIDWKSLFSNKRVYFIVCLKMILIPLAAAAIFKYSPLPTLVADGKNILLVSLFAIMAPTATVITQLAQIYNRDEKYAAAINVLTTVICIVTMPLLTLWYMN